MENIEKIRTKLALNKLRKIILNELKNNYYDNAANVHKIVDIKSVLVKNSSGEEYYHVENIFYWQNGFITFNNFNYTTLGLRMRR